MKFCIKCGSHLVRAEQFSRVRPVCPGCGWVYFPDPKVAVAVIVKEDRKVLLVSRLNEPHRGSWSLPAGFMDAGEDPKAAAERECLEETGLTVSVEGLFDVVYGRSHSQGADVLLVYSARVLGGEIRPGDDAGQAAFFSLNGLPRLAFKSTVAIIKKLKIDSLLA